MTVKALFISNILKHHGQWEYPTEHVKVIEDVVGEAMERPGRNGAKHASEQ